MFSLWEHWAHLPVPIPASRPTKGRAAAAPAARTGRTASVNQLAKPKKKKIIKEKVIKSSWQQKDLLVLYGLSPTPPATRPNRPTRGRGVSQPSRSRSRSRSRARAERASYLIRPCTAVHHPSHSTRLDPTQPTSRSPPPPPPSRREREREKDYRDGNCNCSEIVLS